MPQISAASGYTRCPIWPIRGAYHLATKTGIFGWNANSKVNFPRIPVGTSGHTSKVVLRFRLERADWNFPFHFTEFLGFIPVNTAHEDLEVVYHKQCACWFAMHQTNLITCFSGGITGLPSVFPRDI